MKRVDRAWPARDKITPDVRESGCSYSRGMNFCYSDLSSPYVDEKCQVKVSAGFRSCHLKNEGILNQRQSQSQSKTFSFPRLPYSLAPAVFAPRVAEPVTPDREAERGSKTPETVYLSGPVSAHLALSGQNKILVLGSHHQMKSGCARVQSRMSENFDQFIAVWRDRALSTTWDVTGFLGLFFLSEQEKGRSVDFFLEHYFPDETWNLFLYKKKESSYEAKVYNFFYDYFNKKRYISNIRFHYTDLRFWIKEEKKSLVTMDNTFVSIYEETLAEVENLVRGGETMKRAAMEIFQDLFKFTQVFLRQYQFSSFFPGEKYIATLRQHLLNSLILSDDFPSHYQEILEILEKEKVEESIIGALSANLKSSVFFFKKTENEALVTRARFQTLKLKNSGKIFDWGGISKGKDMASLIENFLLGQVESSLAWEKEISSSMNTLKEIYEGRREGNSSKYINLLVSFLIKSSAVLLEAYYLPRMFLRYEEFPAQSKVIFAGDFHAETLLKFLGEIGGDLKIIDLFSGVKTGTQCNKILLTPLELFRRDREKERLSDRIEGMFSRGGGGGSSDVVTDEEYEEYEEID